MAQGAPGAQGLSAEELAVYDRQLRVWGVDAQQRIRSAQVVVVGAGSMLGGEVCKNLALAGIGRLILLDPRDLDAELVKQHFLARAEDVGKSAAVQLASRLRPLNPMVKIEGFSDQWGVLKQFLESSPDPAVPRLVLFADAFSGKDLVEWNQVCRKAGVQFMAAETFGWRAFYLQDFDGHQALRVIADKQGNEQKALVRLQCPSVRDLLELSWNRIVEEKMFGRRLTHARTLFFAAQLLLKYRDSAPVKHPQEEHFDAVKSLCGALSSGLEKNGISDELLRKFLIGSRRALNPMCSVIGGLVGQEIIKAVSGRGVPLFNVMVYDAVEGSSVCLPILAEQSVVERS